MIDNIGRGILTLIFGIVMFLSSVINVASADPVVGDITVIPRNPAPLSAVTFSVDINGDSFSSVRIIISECNKAIGVCHAPPQNVSMTNVDGNTYEAKVTLKHDDVTSITYHVRIKSEGKWIDYYEAITTLHINSGDSDPDGGNSTGTPGFEILAFLIAIIGIASVVKRIKLK